jgi:hypothetical protein
MSELRRMGGYEERRGTFLGRGLPWGHGLNLPLTNAIWGQLLDVPDMETGSSEF